MAINNQPQLKASMFGRMPVGGAKPKGAGGKGGLPAWRGPKGLRTEHRIGVQADALAIWEIIADLDRWADWNPLYTKASGAIRIGAPLTLAQALPGMEPHTLHGKVLEWVPGDQLHFQMSALGGLVRATRYVEIEELAEGSCIVTTGDITGGLLGPSMARSLQPRLYRGFKAMNEALKARAEAR